MEVNLFLTMLHILCVLYAKALNTYASMYVYVYVYITLAVWQLNTYI